VKGDAALMALPTKPHLKVTSAKTRMDQRGGSDSRPQPFTFHLSLFTKSALLAPELITDY